MKLIRAGLHEEVSVSKTIRALLVIGNVCYAIVKLLTLLVQIILLHDLDRLHGIEPSSLLFDKMLVVLIIPVV